jgi:hypothetical protein
MPNSNTSPQVLQGSRPAEVGSREDGHAFGRLRSVEDAEAYALRCYQDALARADALTGAPAQLWRDAAEAFGAAYQEMLALEGLPQGDGFRHAMELLHLPNHRADEAEAASQDQMIH